MAKILLVDDDVDLCEVLCDLLVSEHNMVDIAHTCSQASEFVKSFIYDSIILDWSLPDGSGIDWLTRERGQGLLTPIIVLTGKQHISDKTSGLDSGADDYLTKPFHHEELMARLRALLRRAASKGTNLLVAGNIKLDSLGHVATKNGEVLKMFPLDFALLELFMRHPGQNFSQEELLNRVWHSEAGSGAESVRSAVKRLRKLIDDDQQPSMIETVFGVGYKFRGN